MSGSCIEFDLSEFETMARSINSAVNRLTARAKSQLLDDIGEEIESQSKERFETKEDPSGKRWEEWSKRYAARQAENNPGASILRGSGVGLYESITHEVDAQKIVTGSNKIYAGVHQKGWEERNIPAREYLGFSDEDQEDIESLVAGFVSRALKGGV